MKIEKQDYGHFSGFIEYVTFILDLNSKSFRLETLGQMPNEFKIKLYNQLYDYYEDEER